MAFYTQQAMSMQSSGGYGQCGVGGMQGGSGQVGGGQMYGFAYDAARTGFGGGGVGGGYCGGAFGGGYSGGAFGGGHGGADAGPDYGGSEMFLNGNEKQTMQNLNDRFATYLDRVKQLEAANVELEKKIKEFLEKQRSGGTTGKGKDYSAYFKTIEELKAKIIGAFNDNNVIVLEADNVRLAADDFKLKYDNELNLRKAVEADIFGLRKLNDDLSVSSSDLGSQAESLVQEIALLKKNHDEGDGGNQQTTVGEVSVEMNAAPGNNLLKKMNEMREQYEALAEKNRKEAEEQFKKASEGVNKEIAVAVEEVKTTKSEVSELRKTLQTLEIELQSQIAMKKSVEETLAQTEGQYCAKIAQIQIRITALEEQVAQIRAEMECQTAEYDDLLGVKAKLENEIATYQKLMDDSNSTGQSSSTPGKGTTSGSTSTSQGPSPRR